MSQTVAETIVTALEKIGVKQIFGLIGDSINPLGDAVRRSTIEWIGVRHEEGAALAACGQAKLTGQLAVCAGTTGPGSTHLVAGLYEAARGHAPVLALSGEMASALRGLDFIQATTPDLLFRDVALYTETITSAEQAPKVIHRAISSAYAGRGVAHLTLPVDILNSKAAGEVSSIETLKPRGDFSPSEADINELLKHINAATDVVIMYGRGCHGLSAELCALSDKLKAPLVHTIKGKDIIAYDDPRCMGGLGMIGTKADYKAVMGCDLLIMIGTDYPYSEFLPSKGKVIQIDERADILGRRTPTILGVVGSARPTLQALINKVTEKTDNSFFKKITAERKSWDEMLDKQASLTRSKDHIHPQALARMVSDLATPDAVFVLDTGLNTLWSGNWLRQTGKQRILGSFNNAAVGTALAQANGIQILDRARQVIALTGDGGFNMLMGEFMTAVQHKLPVKVVIYNNSSFGLIHLEAESIGIMPFNNAINFPNPDFVALARACGAVGFAAKKPGELQAAIAEGLAATGPAIIDVTVVSNEIPNLPHWDAKILQNVAVAKIKEAINAVTGS
jgi:pyruvate dehydrogenase (quinone)